MIIPRKDKPYFYPPFFDISCFWQESTGLSHKIRVYIPFETTMTFTPFLGVMVNRKQFEYFTIEDNPMRKPNAKLLSDEDANSLISFSFICQSMFNLQEGENSSCRFYSFLISYPMSLHGSSQPQNE